MKTIGNCTWNSWWVGDCFGKEALSALKYEAVICSGSTLGSYAGIHHYVRTMLGSMDVVQCWKKGIESDQGYQSYLFYNGKFDNPNGREKAIKFDQGNGVVNTIGAMNGMRVPQDQKGPLDTFWKIRKDRMDFVHNNDGSISACVHQWDRFHEELVHFIDAKLYN